MKSIDILLKTFSNLKPEIDCSGSRCNDLSCPSCKDYRLRIVIETLKESGMRRNAIIDVFSYVHGEKGTELAEFYLK
ncbi:hypothetical protein KY330_03755 [Candidatus Woesearchaeota archaeon]|nr:hypothetical protein [Candidatus Woesearchaeota archaeon]